MCKSYVFAFPLGIFHPRKTNVYLDLYHSLVEQIECLKKETVMNELIYNFT